MSTVTGDLVVTGNLVCQNFTPPPGSITGTMINSRAGVPATAVVRHQAAEHDIADPATTVTAATKTLHIARAAGTLVDFAAAITGAIATGSDRTVTIDLQKSTGGSAFATVLAGTIQFTHSSTLLTASSATLGATLTFVAGDIFCLIVTVAGAASAQATGLHVTFTYEEAHQ